MFQELLREVFACVKKTLYTLTECLGLLSGPRANALPRPEG